MEEDKLDEAAAKDGISVNNSSSSRKCSKPEQVDFLSHLKLLYSFWLGLRAICIC